MSIVYDSHIVVRYEYCPEGWFVTLTPRFLYTSLKLYTVGIPFSSFKVNAESSKPFVKYFSVSATCILSGNTSVTTFPTSFPFSIRKSISCSCSSRLSPVFAQVLPTSTSIRFHPVTQLQLHPLPQLAPYCPLG